MKPYLLTALALGLAVVSATAQDEQSQSFFVDKTGVPTLTNRPDYYRSDDRFKEVEIVYDPIILPDRFDFTSTGRIETDRDYESLIGHYSRRYGLNASLVKAVIKAESNFDPFAVSKVGAQGLMQLMPGTAAEMRVRDAFDPGQNIAGGTQYLYKLLRLYKDDLDLALAAYNAGPGTVAKHGGVPPYSETKDYIAKVRRYMNDFAGGRASVRINRGTHRPTLTFNPTREAPIVVHFKSGTRQPAQSVTEHGDMYHVTYGRSTYSIRKSLVERVESLN